jgi:hypothetical protein
MTAYCPPSIKRDAPLHLPAIYSERLTNVVNFFYKKQKGIGDSPWRWSQVPSGDTGKPALDATTS